MTRVRIKICGVTTPQDAVFALDCGADAIGLNFYSKSPRCLSEVRASEILREVPPLSATVGVFVDHLLNDVTAIASRLGLTALQTYDSNQVGQLSWPMQHIPAFRIGTAEQLQSLDRLLFELGQLQRLPTAILVDSFVPGEMGGTGHTAPWDLLATWRPTVPLILAGGLTPDNVAKAVAIVKPWAVDVASGVESAPGVKDPVKVRTFVQAVRAVTS